MPTYVISYDLNKPGQNYSGLYEAIKAQGSWCHCLDSTWMVVSDKSAEAIRNAITAKMDANDAILVTVATAPGAWRGLDQDCSDWLKRNL